MSSAIANATGVKDWRDIRNGRRHKLITKDTGKENPPAGFHRWCS